jgi:hypothetical protein
MSEGIIRNQQKLIKLLFEINHGTIEQSKAIARVRDLCDRYVQDGLGRNPGDPRVTLRMAATSILQALDGDEDY